MPTNALSPLTLYARKEPTTDDLSIRHGLHGKKDVVFYKDEACTRLYCRWTWDKTPPRSGAKSVVLNCYRWALKWLPPTSVVRTAAPSSASAA